MPASWSGKSWPKVELPEGRKPGLAAQNGARNIPHRAVAISTVRSLHALSGSRASGGLESLSTGRQIERVVSQSVDDPRVVVCLGQQQGSLKISQQRPSRARHVDLRQAAAGGTFTQGLLEVGLVAVEYPPDSVADRPILCA